LVRVSIRELQDTNVAGAAFDSAIRINSARRRSQENKKLFDKTRQKAVFLIANCGASI